MTSYCESCGHTVADHEGGRCAAESFDSEYGRYACICPVFVRDPDYEGD